MTANKSHGRMIQGETASSPTRDSKTTTRTKGGLLQGRRIAILATDGFEQIELTAPRAALDGAGAETVLIAPHGGSIRGWQQTDWGDQVMVDMTVEEARADEFDALLLPGGVMNPDALRTNKRAVALLRSFFKAGKPVAAICHGPILMIEADVLRGRHLTSWPSLQTDIKNAGGTWTDRDVVVDHGLVTSRKPSDIPAFNETMIEEFRASAIDDRTKRDAMEMEHGNR